MPQTRHTERHFTAGETVRDIVIGMSDGLTVPFALAAGLTGAIDSAGIIVTAGLAEIAAGAIAMGLGGYLAANTDDGRECQPDGQPQARVNVWEQSQAEPDDRPRCQEGAAALGQNGQDPPPGKTGGDERGSRERGEH